MQRPGNQNSGSKGSGTSSPPTKPPTNTCAYVVRPADSAKFNGIVLVNWQNVTIGADFGIPDAEELEGVTPGSGSPRSESPTRTNPRWARACRRPSACASGTRSAMARCTTRATPSPTTSSVRALGRCVRTQPLASTCWGHSARACSSPPGAPSRRCASVRISTSPTKRTVSSTGSSSPSTGGLCPRPPDMSLVESFELTPEFKFNASSQIRDDGGVPILVVNSESETMMVSMVHQPDSETFRFWEMAGNGTRWGRVGRGNDRRARPRRHQRGIACRRGAQHDRLGLRRPGHARTPGRMDRYEDSSGVDSSHHPG